jgi:carbonic anhydrase/acetyltransferase-like protein (isoleucine patch superfamily)
VIHAATLEDESLVGAGAQVLDKAVVQKHAAVASGAVLTPGKVVPTGQVCVCVCVCVLTDWNDALSGGQS